MMHRPNRLGEAQGGDPLGCRRNLAEALAAPELDEFDGGAGSLSPAARAAALELAIALGQCRLFGAGAGEADGTLPEAMAVAAAEALIERLPQWIEDATTLPQRWDQAVEVEPLEAEDLCTGLLELRMDLWAAWVAIEEALFDQPVGGVLDTLSERLIELDDALQSSQVLPLLATAAETELFDNWRAFLAPRYREAPPWWLDGTLERIARASYERMLAELPRPRVTASSAATTPAHLVQIYRQALHAPLRIAAAAATPPRRTVIRWDAPDGRWVAYLHLAPRQADASAAETLSIAFYTREGDPAQALSGRPVQLDGVASVIGEQGTATFRWDELAAAPSQDLRLEVGPAWQTWTLHSE